MPKYAMAAAPPAEVRFKETIVGFFTDICAIFKERNISLKSMIDEFIAKASAGKDTDTNTYMKIFADLNMHNEAEKTITLFINVTPDKDLITSFVEYTHDMWQLIKKRDHGAFIQIECSQPTLIFLQSLLSSSYDKLSDDDKKVIWEYLFALVRIALSFVHDERGPYADANRKPLYEKASLYPYVGDNVYKEWDVKRRFPAKRT